MNHPNPISTDHCCPTEQDCIDGVILAYDNDGQWRFVSLLGFRMRQLKWWIRLPAKPPEAVAVVESALEQAWLAYWRESMSGGTFYNSFKAGWEAGRRDAALLKGKCDQ